MLARRNLIRVPIWKHCQTGLGKLAGAAGPPPKDHKGEAGVSYVPTAGGGSIRLFKISLSMVAWRSSLDELTLEGCEAVGESNEVTVGKGDNGKGLNGEPAAAAAKAAGE